MRYLICLLVSLVVVGCSCSETAEERIAETIAEKALEAQTGQKADIDVDKESMTITTEDGKMTMTSGKGARLPENFPEDIPIYKGYALDMAMEMPKGYSVSFTTKDDVSTVSEWYLTEMTDKGWTKEASMDMGDQKMLVFKKGERGVNLVVAPDPDKDQTRVALTSIKG